jgi:transcriptional regulator with XRE-family HTH domain
MTGSQAIAIIHRLGISQAKFGRLAGISAVAVSKWARGGPPSPPVATLLRLLEARPELVPVLERIAEERIAP